MLSGRLSVAFGFAVLPIVVALTACGSQLLRFSEKQLATGIDQNDSELGGSTAAIGQSADSDKVQQLVSESADIRFTAEIASRSTPIFSNGELKFRSAVTLLTFGEETAAKVKRLSRHSLEIFRTDGSLAYSETKTGSSVDWSLSSLRAGYYKLRLRMGFETQETKNGLDSLETPPPIEFEIVVDTLGPDFTIDSAFELDEQKGESLLTIKVNQAPLDAAVLQGRQGFAGAPREVLREAELIERCDPVFIARSNDSSSPVAAVYLNKVGAHEFTSPKIVLDGALSAVGSLGSSLELLARVKCYDRSGNGVQKSISLRSPAFSVSLGVAIANSSALELAVATPLEATAPLPFLGASDPGSTGIDLELQILRRADAQKVSEDFLSKFAKSLRVSYRILPTAELQSQNTTSAIPMAIQSDQLLPFQNNLNLPPTAFEKLSGPISIVVDLFALEGETPQFLASQKVEVYRDLSAPDLEFSKNHPRTKVSQGAGIALQFTTPKLGAGIVKSLVEISTNGKDWTTAQSTPLGIPDRASIQELSSEVKYQIEFKYPFEREMPLRARIRSTDLLGQSSVSPVSGPLTLSEQYFATPLFGLGTSIPDCASPVTGDQAIPKLVLQSRLVCHDSAQQLSDAPYVRLLLALENGSEVPFKLADGKTTLNLQIVTSSGLVQTLAVNIAQASGRKHSDNDKAPLRVLVPISTTLLSADRIWIEWDFGQNASVFDAAQTCQAPAAGRPRVEVQDTLQDSKLIFDSFGCE